MLKVNTNAVVSAMLEQNMQYYELAAEAGVTRATITSIMKRGTARPLTLGKIAKALKVPVDKLLG